jgi:hypothetical protein
MQAIQRPVMVCHSDKCNDAIKEGGVSPTRNYSCKPEGCHDVKAVPGDPSKFTFGNTSSNDKPDETFTAVCNGGKWVWLRDHKTPVNGVNTYVCVDDPDARNTSDGPSGGSSPGPGASDPSDKSNTMMIVAICIAAAVALAFIGAARFFYLRKRRKLGETPSDPLSNDQL